MIIYWYGYEITVSGVARIFFRGGTFSGVGVLGGPGAAHRGPPAEPTRLIFCAFGRKIQIFGKFWKFKNIFKIAKNVSFYPIFQQNLKKPPLIFLRLDEKYKL